MRLPLSSVESSNSSMAHASTRNSGRRPALQRNSPVDRSAAARRQLTAALLRRVRMTRGRRHDTRRNDARDAFGCMLLSIDGGAFASSLISRLGARRIGALRRRVGYARHHRHGARVGGGPAGNLVLVGQSALVLGALPFAHDGCATTSACGACVDGFSTGATNVSFARAVEAGDVLQLAAIPAHFDGGRVAGEISFRFSPGGALRLQVGRRRRAVGWRTTRRCLDGLRRRAIRAARARRRPAARPRDARLRPSSGAPSPSGASAAKTLP